MKDSLRVLFWLFKAKKNKKGLMPIYIRITLNNSKVEIASGHFIQLSQWSKTRKMLIENTQEGIEINNSLAIQKAKIIAIYNQLSAAGSFVTAEDIRKKLVNNQPKYTVLFALNYHNSKMKELVGKTYSIGTYKNYVYLEDKIKAFIKHAFNRGDILLEQLNYQFLIEFEQYLKTVHNNRQNTVAKNITGFKKIINFSLDMEWMPKDPFRNFKNKKEEPPRTYLTKEEVETVISKAMPNRHLQLVKDLIIFQIFTGIAYSDLRNLTLSNAVTGVDGNKWLDFKRQKTNTRTSLPLLPKALEILIKYADRPAGIDENRVFPLLSNQKMNKQIKKIMAICKIEKNISSHSFRRTFATTITLSNGVPIETVSKMLGHRDIKTTQIYAKVVDTKISNDMKKLM